MPIFLREEESDKLGGKNLQMSKDVVDYISKLHNQYDNKKEYKSLPGYKRLQYLFNNPNMGFSPLKKLDFDLKHMDKDSLQYAMSGGDVVSNWASNALKSARNGVKEVGMVPEVPKLEKDTSLNVDEPTKQASVGGIDVNVRMENKSFEDSIRKVVD
jgi:hypothetical protein